MTTITQKIPNLLGGISQQPDAKKYPGEVRDMVNAFPEYALGLMKRPGAKLEASLRGAATPGGTEGTREWGATEKWFDINIDGVPYVGQINDYENTGVAGHHINLKLWYKESGLPRAVSYDDYYSNPAYISSGSWATYVSNINLEATALSNKVTGLGTFQTEQKTYYTNYQATADQFTNIFDISTTYNLGEVYQFINNAILEDPNGNISYLRDGSTMTGSLPVIQATANVSLDDSTLTSLSVTAPGSGYQFAPTLDINGSGNLASGTLTLKERGTFAGIEITNPGRGYQLEPIVTLTGDLAEICHPKCTMTGTTDNRFATGEERDITKVKDIQLNPGKEIKLYEAISCQDDGSDAYYMDDSISDAVDSRQSATVEECIASEVVCTRGNTLTSDYLTAYQGSGTGWDLSQNNYASANNVRLPEKYIGARSGSYNIAMRIYIRPQDLTNVHTIRVYGVSGYTDKDQNTEGVSSGPIFNNGLRKPSFDDYYNAAYHIDSPEWATLEFSEVVNWPYTTPNQTHVNIDGEFGNKNNRYLLRDANRPKQRYLESFPSVNYTNNDFPRDFMPPGTSFDDEYSSYMPMDIPGNILKPEDGRYGYTDIVVPPEFRKPNVRMKIHCEGLGNHAFTTMHLLEDLPAEINDCTITLSTNPLTVSRYNELTNLIEANVDPITPATARVIVNKGVETVTLNAAGSGYQDNVQTTTTVDAPICDSFNITNQGVDYETTPTVTISGGNGTGATAVAELESTGRFKSIKILDPGTGYTAPPTITLGGSLIGRTATATVSAGEITEITLDPNTIDCTSLNDFLTTVDPNLAHHRPTAGVSIQATGNGQPRRDPDTKNPNPAGTGFNIGTHLYFGEDTTTAPNDTSGKRWIITKGINTNLTDQIRVKAILGTDSSTDGSTNGGFYDLSSSGRGNPELWYQRSYSDHYSRVYINHDEIQGYYYVGDGTETSSDFCTGNSANYKFPSYHKWTPLPKPVVDRTLRKRDGLALTDYFTDIPEDARGEHVYFLFTQYAGGGHAADGSGYADSHHKEVGITEIEFVDTTDYVIPQTIEDNATVAITGGGGADGQAALVLGHRVLKITATDTGSDFTANPTVQLTGGDPTTPATAQTLMFGSGATVEPTFTQTFSPVITDRGLGYISATGTITDTEGSGATADVTISQGKIQTIEIAGGDGKYITGPTLTISAPTLTASTTFPIYASTGEFTETSTGRVFKIGVDKTDAYPILMNRLDPDSKIWELIEVTKATDADASALATYESGTYATAQSTYESLITAHNTAVTTTDGSYPTFDTSILPANDYFADDLNGGTVDLSKLKVVTFQDTTFILNPTKKVAYTNYKTPVAKFDDGFLFFNVLTAGDYKVEITKLLNDPSGKEPHEVDYIRTPDTSFGSGGTITGTATYSTSVSDVEALRSALETSLTSAYGSFSNDFDFIKSGNGIYIKSKGGFANVQFELEVSGPTGDAIDAIRHSIGAAENLPAQVVNGYKVKVVNTTDVNADDMYLEFQTETDNDYSAGTWVEAPGFDIPIKIDKTTMPHALTVNSDGSFSFAPWPHWEDRLVGDEVTNPTPHFISTVGGVNRYIKDIFVYRNRLGFLTEDYVSLSKAGEFFNFFAKSAVASGNDDPIDISVSDNDSPSLNYVSKETAGLLLYGKTGQYLLATDSDILSPTTAKINKVAGYEADMDNPAISLGATTAFISKTASTTKMFELLKVNALEPPQSIEQTRTVPELVPTNVDSIVGSPDVGLVSFGKIGEKDLYQFNYLRAADQELGSAWYKWKLPGNLEHQFFDGNSYHTILRTDNNEHFVVSFDVSQSSTDGVLSLESGKKTDLHLDVFQNNPFTTYTEVAGGSYVNKTKVYLPTAKISGLKLVVVMYSNRSQVFDEDNVTYTTGSDSYGDYVEVSGDWRGSDVFIGYKFDMSVELPRMYFKKSENNQVSSDVDADLILHRLRVKTGLSGPVEYKIKIIGIPVRTSTVSVTPPEQYLLNSVNMTESAVHDVPVYQRNNNTTITIQSNSAFPTTIESINWEGRYSTNYYRRS